MKRLLGLGILGLSLLLLSITVGCSTSTENNQTVNLKGLSAERVLDQYLSNFNFVGVTEKLAMSTKQKELSCGFKLEDIKVDEEYWKQRKSLNDELIATCIELRNEVELDFCGGAVSILKYWENMTRNITVLSKKQSEENSDTIKIEISYESEFTLYDNTSMNTYNVTFILKKDANSIWKVCDYVDEFGRLGSGIPDYLNARKLELENSLKKEKEILKQLKSYLLTFQQTSAAIGSVIPSERIIGKYLYYYDNDSTKYVVGIIYYFKGEFLTDDYLQIMSDSSELFKETFSLNPSIYQVQTIVKEKYADEYGNSQEKYLARTLMDRDTYNKINWEEFKSSNLDKVAQVSFYGNSLYKSLSELRDNLQGWRDFSMGEIPTLWEMPILEETPTIENAPANLCDDAKIQCNQYEDCEVYNMLKAQGMCT